MLTARRCTSAPRFKFKLTLATLAIAVLPVSESLAQWNITSYRAAKVQLYTDHEGRNPVLAVDRALAPKFATEQDATTRFFRVNHQGRSYWIDADTVTAHRVASLCANKSPPGGSQAGSSNASATPTPDAGC